MANVFISYSREDRDHSAELAAALGQHGHQVWWDWHLSGGADFRDAIKARLEAAEKVIVLWSVHSVGSDFVIDEAGLGKAGGKLVPVSLDGTAPPLGFRALHTIDWTPSGDLAPVLAALAGESIPEAVVLRQVRMRRVRRGALAVFGIGLVGVASAIAVRWIPGRAGELCAHYDMAGSVMRAEVSGASVRIVYEKLRETISPDGWMAGDWVFEGTASRSGGTLALDGRARGRGQRCGFFDYPVNGAMDPTTRIITLQGNKPVRRTDCTVMGSAHDTLVMTCRP
jgi:hypothetical protein